MLKTDSIVNHLAAALSHKRSLSNSTVANTIWENRVNAKVETFAQYLPSGSGVDSGTTIEEGDCTDSRIVLSCGFHHMNDAGYYTQWTQHKIILDASFGGFNIRVTGRNINDIKDYLADLFHSALSLSVTMKSTKEMDTITHCA